MSDQDKAPAWEANLRAALDAVSPLPVASDEELARQHVAHVASLRRRDPAGAAWADALAAGAKQVALILGLCPECGVDLVHGVCPACTTRA